MGGNLTSLESSRAQPPSMGVAGLTSTMHMMFTHPGPDTRRNQADPTAMRQNVVVKLLRRGSDLLQVVMRCSFRGDGHQAARSS